MIRIFDIVFSAVGIIVLFPFVIPIIICLKLTGEHNIFYLQPRVGKGGKSFNVIKFATMLKNSPNLPGGYITQSNDPRVLPIGRFLRKSKINELPQLFNVFIGQMSIVGPRPIVAQHLDLYTEKVKNEILTMTPGLTGIASLIFRDEEGVLDRIGGDRKYVHDMVIAPYKGELELWWIKHYTIRNYLKIIVLTACALFIPHVFMGKMLFKDLPETPELLRPKIS